MNLLADNKPAFKRLNSKIIHNGEYINLRQDELFKEEKHLSTRDVIEHVGSIVAVPYEIINQKVYVYMVKQWRNPVDEWLLEFPAGTLNDHEDPNKAVKRELQEEIGMVPQDIKLWSPFYVAPGWCTEKIYCFFVTNLKSSKLESDIDEEIYIERLELSKIHQMIKDKKIIDLKTITSFYVFKEFLSESMSPNLFN